MNALGKRSDGSKRDELIVRVFPNSENIQSEFTLYEDDGITIGYQKNQVRTTRLTQNQKNDYSDRYYLSSSG